MSPAHRASTSGGSEDTTAISPRPKSARAKASLLGTRLALHELSRTGAAARSPLTFEEPAGGWVVLFRFGALVTIDLEASAQRAWHRRLEPLVEEPHDEPAVEEVDVAIDRDVAEGVTPRGVLTLRRIDLGRAHVLALVLAKSAVLDYYEIRVAQVFDRVEVLAKGLREARLPRRPKALLRELGDVLLIQSRMVGRVEVSDKPELVWDDPELDLLYERFASEFELRERDHELSRKLDLISGVAETYLELLNNRQTLRVEWYIVILILVEIVLSLYMIFGPSPP